MENQFLNLESGPSIREYILQRCVVKHEVEIANEILKDIKNSDQEKLDWYNQFGKSIRSILYNLYAHRKQMEFGFTNIDFDEYGWLIKPDFIEQEDIHFGNLNKIGEYGTIQVGRGLNHVWTTAMFCSYGFSGGGSTISVFDKQYSTRATALNASLATLKANMLSNVGNQDTTNFKQNIILATLQAIDDFQIGASQLTLF